MGPAPTTIMPPRAAPIIVPRKSFPRRVQPIARARLVTLCAPAGSGEVIAALLSEAYAHGPALDNPADRFAAMLVARADSGPAVDIAAGDEPFGLSGRVASREVDILIMVGGGLRNREIGERLGLTRGRSNGACSRFMTSRACVAARRRSCARGSTAS